MEKIKIRIEKGKEINELSEVDGGILTHVYIKNNEKNIDSNYFGELDDEEILMSGIAAYASSVNEFIKRKQEKGEEIKLELIGLKTVNTLNSWGFNELVDEINDAYDNILNEDMNNDLDYQDDENPLASLFGFAENQDHKQEFFHEEIEVNCSEGDEDSTGDLKLYSILIKNEENENVVQTEIKGSGQIQEIIELGCASYTNAIEFAKQEVMKIDSHANPMVVNLQISQKAAQLMMKHQLGDASGFFENMFSGLFNSFLDDESNDEKE